MEDSKRSGKSEWKHPDQIMELRRLKMKAKIFQARMDRKHYENTRDLLNQNNEFDSDHMFNSRQTSKRKNPFPINDTNKKLKDLNPLDLDASNDSILFELINLKSTKIKESATINKKESFASVSTKLGSPERVFEREVLKGGKNIPMDWTIHTKMRLMSVKPFAWNGKLTTSEEASGTTGFVRCLDIGERETTLDTTLNARFHRHCLIWQHPSLPWIELYPRNVDKASSSLGNNFSISSSQNIKDALYKEWSESFRSLFHLLRTRQCPYFYVCANSFTALFRAAGICGLSEIHALLTPTTRGFREALKQEEIEFAMPLRKIKTQSTCGATNMNFVKAYSVSCLPSTREQLHEEDEIEEKWLESLGVEEAEIRKINNSQTRLTLEKECELDSNNESLIFVMGVEAQALFNFLINCKSATTAVGTMAGIPPTLLAPVAFNGATLKSLKVRESEVLIEKKKFYSLELRGPLLPHVLPSLCSLMKSSERDNFSVSCAQSKSTTSFSKAKHGQGGLESEDISELPKMEFSQAALVDCGFSRELLEHFCNPDPTTIQVLENVKFSNDMYSWM